MCDEPCVACSKHCERSDADHVYDAGVPCHEHEYTYGTRNRSGSNHMVTIIHKWYSVPTLDDEVKRLAP